MRDLMNRVLFVSREPSLREIALTCWIAGAADMLFTAAIVWAFLR